MRPGSGRLPARMFHVEHPAYPPGPAPSSPLQGRRSNACTKRRVQDRRVPGLQPGAANPSRSPRGSGGHGRPCSRTASQQRQKGGRRHPLGPDRRRSPIMRGEPKNRATGRRGAPSAPRPSQSPGAHLGSGKRHDRPAGPNASPPLERGPRSPRAATRRAPTSLCARPTYDPLTPRRPPVGPGEWGGEDPANAPLGRARGP